MQEYCRTKIIYLVSKINRHSPYYLLLKKLKELIPNFILSRLSPYLMAAISERRYLEETILPALNRLNPERILFIGVRSYTVYYGNYFQKSEYWTIDIDPKVVIYGSNKHIVGDVLEIDRFFSHNFFDIVILNGVFGYGINNNEDQNKTFEKIHRIIKPNGIMVLGWDMDRVKEPLELEAAKKYFSHCDVANFPNRKTFDDSPKVYDFLRS